MKPLPLPPRPSPAALLALGGSLLLCGCSLTPSAPSAAVNLTATSQYVFRGVPQNEKGALQPDMNLTFPTAGGGELSLGAWANLNIRDDTGDAVFPNGNGGDFTEIDLIGSYSSTIADVGYTLGVINYTFPGQVASGVVTTEVFGAAEWESAGWSHTLTAYWDVDEISGLYARADVGRSWDLDARTAFNLGMGVGYSDSDHARTYYGVPESGVADLTATGSITYRFDAHTTGSIFLSAATLVDGAYEDAVRLAGIETENLWAGVGLGWGF